jgi:hypothetical protein
MSATRFQYLCEEACDLLDVPRFALAADAEGTLAYHLERHGVMVNVMHFPPRCEDHAFMLFELGPIPYEDPAASAIVLALLDANFISPDPYPPALGRDPDSGEAILRCVFPLVDATAGGLVEAIDRGVAVARRWQQDYFLPVQPALASDRSIA